MSTLNALEAFGSQHLRRTVAANVIGQSADEAVPLPPLASSAPTAFALFRFARSGLTILVPRARLVSSCVTFGLVLPVPVLHVLETRSQFFFGGHTTDSYVASQSPMRNAVDDPSSCFSIIGTRFPRTIFSCM